MFPDNRLLRDSVYKVIGNIAQSEIGIVARPDDNGAVYKCTANNAALRSALEVSVTLTVLCESSAFFFFSFFMFVCQSVGVFMCAFTSKYTLKYVCA